MTWTRGTISSTTSSSCHNLTSGASQMRCQYGVTVHNPRDHKDPLLLFLSSRDHQSHSPPLPSHPPSPSHLLFTTALRLPDPHTHPVPPQTPSILSSPLVFCPPSLPHSHSTHFLRPPFLRCPSSAFHNSLPPSLPPSLLFGPPLPPHHPLSPPLLSAAPLLPSSPIIRHADYERTRTRYK